MASTDTPRSAGDTDAPHLTPTTPEEDARTILINEVNWGAVFAGAALALTAQLILNMIGIAIGAASINPLAGDNPTVSSFSIGAGIWWAVSGIIAAFAGGIAAGRLCGTPKETTAGWHGLISWAFTTLFMFYLITATAGSIASSTTQAVSNVAGGIAQTAGGAMQTAAQSAAPVIANGADPFAAIERNIRSAIGGQDPAALRDAAVAAMRGLVTGDPAQQQQARERAAEAVSKAQGIPIEQARTQVQQYEQQYRQGIETAKQQAAEAADTARKAVSSGSLLAAIALLLGAVAAWFGGRTGVVDPTITAERLRSMSRRAFPPRTTPSS